MSYSKVYCPSCGAVVPADDINIKALIGKCDDCDHVFDLPQKANKKSNQSKKSGPLDFDGSAPPRPKKIQKEVGPSNELYLKKAWFSPMYFGLMFFCIAWDSFLVFWYSIAFTTNAPWLMLVFPIGHLAIGVGMTYTVIAGLFNKTHIFADRYTIIVRHRPIPWKGNRELECMDIKRLYLEEKLPRNHQNLSRTLTNYDLKADIAGDEVTILSGLETSEARYIIYELAKAVKIDLNS